MSSHSGIHVALIMDGNGRWAQRRGLPRLAGHLEGERALRRIVRAAPAHGISLLTVYAFSSDNWKRPAHEVNGLMQLLETHLLDCVESCRSEGVRITVIGRRDRIPNGALEAIEYAEQQTRCGERVHLRVAIDYSSRHALRCTLNAADRSPTPGPDVDLLIRTGGEQRLSDFLLWECAYAELVFLPCLWPDFGPDDLAGAIREFQRRERRFGGLVATP